MINKSLKVEAFNREVERVAKGGEVTNDLITPEDKSALKLAKRLTVTDFSGSSTIRQSLRCRLVERAARYPVRDAGLRRFVSFRDGRTLAGTGIAILLIFVWAFGFLPPQHASATPAFITAEASSVLPGKPAASLTVAVTHNRGFIPKPAPTPMTISVSTAQSPVLPVRTPNRTNFPLGSPFPIVTIIILK
jgi:hypothetical protein